MEMVAVMGVLKAYVYNFIVISQVLEFLVNKFKLIRYFVFSDSCFAMGISSINHILTIFILLWKPMVVWMEYDALISFFSLFYII